MIKPTVTSGRKNARASVAQQCFPAADRPATRSSSLTA